jgi:hypothetical protein
MGEGRTGRDDTAARGPGKPQPAGHVTRAALLGGAALLALPTAALAATAADSSDAATHATSLPLEAVGPVIIVTAIVPEESRFLPGSADVVDRRAIEERAPITLRD